MASVRMRRLDLMVKTMATPRAQNHEAVVIRSQPENPYAYRRRNHGDADAPSPAFLRGPP